METTPSYGEERKFNSPEQVKISRAARAQKSLKADVKLTTAFVKKVSTITDDTALALIRDINEKLNLTRFVEEVVTSLAKAPIKMKDIPMTTSLCSAMHRSYEGFLDMLYQMLNEQYEQACKSDDKNDIIRRRILLRWFGEMYCVGLIEPDSQNFIKHLRMATRAGCPPGALPEPLPETLPPLPDAACSFIGGISALLKGLGNELLPETEQSTFPPSQIKSRISLLLSAYVLGALSRLNAERGTLKRIRRKLDNDTLHRGEVSQEATEAFERREKACEELYQGIVPLCDILKMPKPLTPEEVKEDEEENDDQEKAKAVGIELWSKRKGAEAELSFEAWIWGEESLRSFYEDLDDLVEVIPRVILERPDQALRPEVLERLKGEITKKPVEEEKKIEDEKDVEGDAADMEGDGSEALQEEEEENEFEAGSKKVETVIRPVEELMSRLPNMLSERSVDAFARDFAHLNSKSARKRLVQELFQVPWGRTELLPFYARLAATLSKVYIGIGRPLVDSVRAAFYRCTKDRRPGSRLGSRLRYSKYLGELVKFGVKCHELECPPAATFRALKQTFDFFQGENIDMACALLETCGRELYRIPKTHSVIEKYLESFQRHRTAKMLGPVHDAMVDNAYYHCVPADPNAAKALARKVRRERTEIEKFVRHLLLEKLGEYENALPNENRTRTLQRQGSETVNSLFTLPWIDSYEECEESISRSFLASCKNRSGSLPLVCLVISQLSKKYPRIAARVTDDIIEAISLGVERNDFRHNQRRIGQAKCLAHMLRHSIIPPSLFFDTLFMILHRGHEKPTNELTKIPICNMAQAHLFHPAVPCKSDPPYDAFRVRLVCAALESASDKITTQSCYHRLDIFLRYLERYVWNKAYFPIDVEFYMLDTLQDLERKVTANRNRKRQPRKKNSQTQQGKKNNEKVNEQGTTTTPPPVQFIGRAPNLQVAEDQISTIEGRGFQSVLAVPNTIEEEDEEDLEEEALMSGDDGDEKLIEEEEVVLMKSTYKTSTKKEEVDEHEPTPEDLAFEAEFSKLMKETVEQSGKSNLAGSAIRGDNLVIPMNIKKSVPKPDSNLPGGGVTLQLLKRGANKKVEVKSLVVPDDSLLAKSLSGMEGSKKDILEKEEQQALKRLTLKAAAMSSSYDKT